MAIEKYAMAGWDVMRALHDHTATALLLGSIGILALVNLGNRLVSLVARDEAKTRSHTCPHTDGTKIGRAHV